MQEECDCVFKILLLGDRSVGKSTLLDRIIYDRYDANMEPTVGLLFESKMLTLANNMKANLQLWDIGGDAFFKSCISSYHFGASIICIVLDATNVRQDECSKIEQIRKYTQQINEMGNNGKPVVLIIENKSDCATAVQMSDEELSQLESIGIARSHYIYASAKLNQANDQTLIKCLEKYVQEYIYANPKLINRNPKYVSFNLTAASSQSTPLPFVFSAWWASLFSSQRPAEFYGASRSREQIHLLSAEGAITILKNMHKHLVKGNATATKKEPYELSFGGGIDTLTFFDKSNRKEITLQYKHKFPHHVMTWLSLCAPYVYYRTQLPNIYVTVSKNELLKLFNSIVLTTCNLKHYCRRYLSTKEFYNQLPTFLISQIHQQISGVDGPTSSLRASAASGDRKTKTMA